MVNSYYTQDNNFDEKAISELSVFLLTNFPEGLYQYEYFWQYKISKSQYDELKKILLSLKIGEDKNLFSKKPCGKKYGTIARIIVLYVSEWYKRECATLDGDRCLETIGLKSGDSLKIWKESGLPDSLLYKSKNKERKMRQMAMCTLGGLPILYVIRSSRFNSFVNNLSDIYNGKEKTTDEDIEQIVSCFDDRNDSFKKSLESGSCKDYLLSLINYLENGSESDLPFAKSDLDQEFFSSFVKRLKEGYDSNFLKRFFKWEIRIWTHDFFEDGDDSNRIESECNILIGQKSNDYKITTKDLINLGVTIPADVSTFDLFFKIKNKDGSIQNSNEKRTYFKIGNNCNDYCGVYGSALETSINFFELDTISIIIKYGEEVQKVVVDYKMDNYLELYSTDNNYLWTTKTNNAAQKVLFYDTSIYSPQNKEDLIVVEKSDCSNIWGWIYQKSNINLENLETGELKEITLGASELIVVDFLPKKLRRIIDLSPEGYVRGVFDGLEEVTIPLLYYNNKQLTLACDGKQDKDLRDNYILRYKEPDEFRYSEWDYKNVPSQGFIILQISCRNEKLKKKIWKRMVYFIPNKKSEPLVKRNLDNNTIYINSNKVSLLDDSQEGKYKDGCFRYEDSTNGLDPISISTISFRVGDEENYIVLRVYRAFRLQQIWNNNHFIKNVINSVVSKPPIAYILQNRIRIKSINEDGFYELTSNAIPYLDYFKAPKDLSYQIIDGRIEGYYQEDSSHVYHNYVYLSRFEDVSDKIKKIRDIKQVNNAIELHVSKKYCKDYVFYYWSGELSDKPIEMARIEKTNNESITYTYHIPADRLTNKALIFQSLLKNDCHPNLYFRPFYEDAKWDNYISRYGTVDEKYIFVCFNYAVEHHVYFCVFPAMRFLQKRERFSNFFRIYVEKKDFSLNNNDVKELTRLAVELAMDWFFVDRRILFRGYDEDKKKQMRDCLSKVLHYSPIVRKEHAYSCKFIDCFTNKTTQFGVRNGKPLYRVFLNAVDKFDTYDDYKNIENRINLLQEITTANENIFKSICELLKI